MKWAGTSTPSRSLRKPVSMTWLMRILTSTTSPSALARMRIGLLMWPDRSSCWSCATAPESPLARIFHQDAELWWRTGRDRSGSTGAANRSFYWPDGHARYGRPGPARIRVTPTSKLHATLAVHDWLLLRISKRTGGGLVKYPG